MLLVGSTSGIWGMKTALEKGLQGVTVSSATGLPDELLLDEFVQFFLWKAAVMLHRDQAERKTLVGMIYCSWL